MTKSTMLVLGGIAGLAAFFFSRRGSGPGAAPAAPDARESTGNRVFQRDPGPGYVTGPSVVFGRGTDASDLPHTPAAPSAGAPPVFSRMTPLQSASAFLGATGYVRAPSTGGGTPLQSPRPSGDGPHNPGVGGVQEP